MRRTTHTWNTSTGRQESQLFVNEDPGYDVPILNPREYDTFISHKGDDIDVAVQVGDLIHLCGLNGYLDHWDPRVDGDSPELESHLRDVIRQTPSILAIVSESTVTSWWVPFEIGVARETKSVIATVLAVDENRATAMELPSYLKTWPILASAEELRDWAVDLANSRVKGTVGKTIFLEKAYEMSASSQTERAIDRLEREGKVRFVS